MNNIQKKVDDTESEGSEHVARQQKAIYQRLEYAQTTLQWHEIMLCWIEQSRLAMNSLSPTFVQSSGQNTPFHRQGNAKRRNTPTVLGKVKVSKFTAKHQNIRTQAPKATVFKPVSVGSAVTIPSSIQKQMPKRREIKPRRAKENALAQFLSQGLAKADRFVNTETKSPSKTLCSGDGQIRVQARPQRRSATQRLSPTPRIIKTRSQRISREPVRWAPV